MIANLKYALYYVLTTIAEKLIPTVDNPVAWQVHDHTGDFIAFFRWDPRTRPEVLATGDVVTELYKRP